ncbi:MAG: hypothetical protein LBQ03_02650 [Puniceicoccales bacterium]|jgi:hypothetical protein|nr:hypothetical protein [Puniceicoccales bacterium]
MGRLDKVRALILVLCLSCGIVSLSRASENAVVTYPREEAPQEEQNRRDFGDGWSILYPSLGEEEGRKVIIIIKDETVEAMGISGLPRVKPSKVPDWVREGIGEAYDVVCDRFDVKEVFKEVFSLIRTILMTGCTVVVIRTSFELLPEAIQTEITNGIWECAQYYNEVGGRVIGVLNAIASYLADGIRDVGCFFVYVWTLIQWLWVGDVEVQGDTASEDIAQVLEALNNLAI